MGSRPTITPLRLVAIDDGRSWDVPRRGYCRLCDRQFNGDAPADRLCQGCRARVVSWARMLDHAHPLGKALSEGDPPWHPDGALDEQRSWHIDLTKPPAPTPAWVTEALHG